MRLLVISLSAMALAGCGKETTSVPVPDQVQDPVVNAQMPLETGIKGVRYVSVTVSDIDQTLEFYNQGVQYEVVKRYQAPAESLFPMSRIGNHKDKEVEVALVKTPTVFLHLVDFDPSVTESPEVRSVSGPGYTHICFISPSSNSAYAKFRAAGMEMVSRGKEPVDLGGYGMRYAYGLDLDGTMVELEVDETPRRPDAFWVGHVANVTPDIEKMTAFYSDLLGYMPRRTAELFDNPKADEIANIDNVAIKAAWYSTGNLDLEFWQYTNPVTPPHSNSQMLDRIGYNSIAFEVQDLQKEVERLAGMGVAVIEDFRFQEGWRVAYFSDPDGNVFSLQQNESAAREESIDDLIWMHADVD